VVRRRRRPGGSTVARGRCGALRYALVDRNDGHGSHEGDCVAKALSAGAVPETVDVVPCEHRHAHEVYAVVDLPSGPFPGETIVSRLADHRCTTEFRDFDGISIDRSVLDILFMYPTDAQQWSYHRSVICMASGAAPTSHSYAGTHH